MAGTGDGLGKGRDAEEEAFLVYAPSGHMVKSRMTVIRVDGELPKNVDLTLESYVYGRADIYLSPFLFPRKVRPGFIFYGEKHTVIESREKERI